MMPAPKMNEVMMNTSRTSHTDTPRCRLMPRQTPQSILPYVGLNNGSFAGASGAATPYGRVPVGRAVGGSCGPFDADVMLPLCAPEDG